MAENDRDERAERYRVDPDGGSVTFGDGEPGRKPPAGSDEAAAAYRYGGGRAGNLLSVLRSLVHRVRDLLVRRGNPPGKDRDERPPIPPPPPRQPDPSLKGYLEGDRKQDEKAPETQGHGQ